MRSFIQITQSCMRAFVLGVGLTLCAVAHAEQGATSNAVNSAALLDEQALFTLVEGFDPEVDASGQVVKTPDLNQKIRQGMRDLLLRLTGDSALLQSDEGREFIRDAKAWLTRYAFEPRKEEGVTVGQNLRLEFDRQRLLKAFQSKNMIVWPQKERPKTLVMGSFLQEGGLLKLTPEALGYRPDVEFRPYPKLLALPLSLPVSENSWVYPLADSVAAEQIQGLLNQSGSQYLLSFRLEKSLQGDNALMWRLYDPSGQSLLSGTANGTNGLALTGALFDRLMAFYSESYRQSASVLGAAVVGVNRLSSAEQLIEVERYLQSQRPAVHQATLVGLQGSRAEFEVVYQGRYQDLLNVCLGIEGAQLQSQSALTAQIELLLPGVMERPATQLIDLSKEFEANMREGQ